ncbi:peptidoglycan-binding domain-containing protein [Streptomyces chartreusis]
MTRSSGILSAGLLLAGLVSGTIAAASPASAAATYECNTSKALAKGQLQRPAAASELRPYWCYLIYGSQNSGVSALQSMLNKCRGAGLAVNGMYGPATRSAVTSVQQRVGVAADAEYGPATVTR